jgi:hypothetical protein
LCRGLLTSGTTPIVETTQPNRDFENPLGNEKISFARHCGRVASKERSAHAAKAHGTNRVPWLPQHRASNPRPVLGLVEGANQLRFVALECFQ